MIGSIDTDVVPQTSRFPFVTAAGTLTALFLFVGIMMYVYRSPNPLGDAKSVPSLDPIEKGDVIRARNKAVLDGHDPSVRMSVKQSTAAILEQAAKLKSDKFPYGRLPFPTEPKSP